MVSWGLDYKAHKSVWRHNIWIQIWINERQIILSELLCVLIRREGRLNHMAGDTALPCRVRFSEKDAYTWTFTIWPRPLYYGFFCSQFKSGAYLIPDHRNWHSEHNLQWTIYIMPECINPNYSCLHPLGNALVRIPCDSHVLSESILNTMEISWMNYHKLNTSGQLYVCQNPKWVVILFKIPWVCTPGQNYLGVIHPHNLMHLSESPTLYGGHGPGLPNYWQNDRLCTIMDQGFPQTEWQTRASHPDIMTGSVERS